MQALTLVIGNKNDSSWSMRPRVMLSRQGLPFREVKLRVHSPEREAGIGRWSPSGLAAVTLSPLSARYCEAVRAAPGVAARIAQALDEPELVSEVEPCADPPAP